MAQVFRWLMRLASLVVALIVIGVGLAYYLASRSLPEYDKELSVSGLTADVEIVRDNSAVPHIMALSDRDAFFALGYVHAQDRLWQLMVMRRTAQGRLSETFGRRTVRTDTLLRRLDIYTAAKASVAHQDARTLDALEAYAAGINTRISEINFQSLGRGAPEYFLFEAEIAPWQPADSLAIIKLMALQLTGHLGDEVLRMQTSLLLNDENRLADILPDMPGAGVAALPRVASLLPEAGTRQAQATPRGGDFLWPVPSRGLAGASNVWAAATERSASQGALLANDPHLGFTAPSIWYLARMELSTGGVIGASIPGIPALMVGRSRQLAWGITSSYLDDQDLFFEEINPDNRNEYRTPDGFKLFETRQSIIRIKDEPPVTLNLLWTDNGPVLPASQFNLDKITPPGHLVTLGWTALSDQDTSASAAVAAAPAPAVRGLQAAIAAAAARGRIGARLQHS